MEGNLRRSTKTPGEVYRIALLYKRGDMYKKSYKSSVSGIATAQAGALEIKSKPISAIRGEYWRTFQRG